MSSLTYVYILTSQTAPQRHYTGLTQNPFARINVHNAGKVSSTAAAAPWHVETTVVFRDRGKALAFERYLKSHSDRAFATRHF